MGYTYKLEVCDLEDTSKLLGLINLGVKYAGISGVFFNLEAVLVIHVTSVICFFFCILMDNDSEKSLLRLDSGKSVVNSLLINFSDSFWISNTLLLEI